MKAGGYAALELQGCMVSHLRVSIDVGLEIFLSRAAALLFMACYISSMYPCLA